MRMLIALLIIIYIVGVGVGLAPAVQGKWATASASELATSVADSLPSALKWPARAYRDVVQHG